VTSWAVSDHLPEAPWSPAVLITVRVGHWSRRDARSALYRAGRHLHRALPLAPTPSSRLSLAHILTSQPLFQTVHSVISYDPRKVSVVRFCASEVGLNKFGDELQAVATWALMNRDASVSVTAVQVPTGALSLGPTELPAKWTPGVRTKRPGREADYCRQSYLTATPSRRLQVTCLLRPLSAVRPTAVRRWPSSRVSPARAAQCKSRDSMQGKWQEAGESSLWTAS